jgi:peptidoglycan lytic transglycosylase G
MRLQVFLAVALVLATLAAMVAGIAFVVSPAPSLKQGPVIVEIPAHVGVTGVAARLREAGVIRSAWAFLAAATARGEVRRLKAGEYEFPREASTFTVTDIIASGRVRQHPVLHPEGATISELARALETERLARADDVLRVAHDPAFLTAHGIEGPSAEGYVFPDTYYFVRGMRPEEILGRMVQRMRAKLTADVAERAKARGLNVHQLLTLASIVEREAIVPDEQRLIAAVFLNRLKLAMPLQADPTVQYAVGKERKTLTRADLMTEHPFNTYRNLGLPPGPIASPGVSAIEAVLDPAPVKYLYFVAVSADGQRHQFSTTGAEHNAAVARYRSSRSQ